MRTLLYKTGIIIASITVLLILLGTCIGAQAKTRTPMLFHALPHLQSIAEENRRADALDLQRFKDSREIEAAVERGTLVPLRESKALRVCRKLPRNRRYALPATVSFIQGLAQEHYGVFHKALQVDSMIRDAETQRKLCRRNRSAAPWDGPYASTHLTGATVDLSKRMSKKEQRWMLCRLGYYRAIGKVLVINEQRCLHIFVIGEHNG